jgi:hypothetical protein
METLKASMITRERNHGIVTESTISYEELFPDLQTLVNGLTVYSAIRDIYDLDRQGFGLDCRSTTGGAASSYIIAHFRRYHSSTEPQVSFDVDMQYVTRYIPDTVYNQVNDHPPPRDPRIGVGTCIDWNKSRGTVHGINVIARMYTRTVVGVILCFLVKQEPFLLSKSSFGYV